MKRSLLSLLFVGILAISFAGEKDIKSDSETESTAVAMLAGQIFDQNTDEPLVGVKVVLEGTEKVAYTDFDGNYNFENIKAGKYKLTASYVSYKESSLENVQVSLTNNQVDIRLNTTN